MSGINARELFAGLNEASAEGRNPKLDKNGNYAFEILATKLTKGYNSGITFVIEFKLIESSDPQNFPVGRECSITINRLQDPKQENRNLALGNMKQFLAAAISDVDFGDGVKQYYDPNSNQDWVEFGVLCAKESTYLAGARVRVQIDVGQTKGGNTFAKPTFRVYDQSLVTKAA